MSEEDEEHEGDATERLRSELGEKYETDMNNLQVIQVWPSLRRHLKSSHLRMQRGRSGSVSYSCDISKEYFRAAGPSVSIAQPRAMKFPDQEQRGCLQGQRGFISPWAAPQKAKRYLS